MLLLDEITWRQKSRATWLREGNKNTRFFHHVANSNRRINTIGRLMVDGAITTDQVEIGAGLVSFYSRLFADDNVRSPLLDGLEFSSIDEEDNNVLEQPFTEEEVLGVVKNMAGDKAPGLDGYSMAFFHKCWDIVKHDVMEVFWEFYTYGTFEKSLNVTFLALIPKSQGPWSARTFGQLALSLGSIKS